MPNKPHIWGAHHLGEFTYTHMPGSYAFIRHSNANQKAPTKTHTPKQNNGATKQQIKKNKNKTQAQMCQIIRLNKMPREILTVASNGLQQSHPPSVLGPLLCFVWFSLCFVCPVCCMCVGRKPQKWQNNNGNASTKCQLWLEMAEHKHL